MHHALKYGAPSSENLRMFQDFVVSYDARLRNPRWVLEHLRRDGARGEANRCVAVMCKSCCSALTKQAGMPPTPQEERGVLRG